MCESSSKGLQNNFNIYNENFNINDLLFIVEDIKKISKIFLIFIESDLFLKIKLKINL